MRALPFSACLLLRAVTLHAQSASGAKAPTLSWGPAPAAFPSGAKMAVVSGDPGKTGPFTVHPTDEAVEVKKGSLLVGMGDALDVAKTNAMKVGAKGQVPALAHHYAVARGATVVSITAMGPFAMTYVHPADDPRTAPHP